jgi:LPXTG-site transpeptidase (sortase) family protein
MSFVKIQSIVITSLVFAITLATLTTGVQATTSTPLLGATEHTWLTPHPANPGADFADVLAVYGNTMVVGARQDRVSSRGEDLFYAGAVYVYVKQDGDWVQQARLTAKDPHWGDMFGSSVDIYGDMIVVGAPGRDWDEKDDDDDRVNVGAVYVFTRSGDEWSQQARIDPYDGADEDNFGSTVALVSNRIAVGATGKDMGPLAPNAGMVYLYVRADDMWHEAGELTAAFPTPLAVFGSALAMEGSRLVVSAPEENERGVVYVFYRTGSSWVLEDLIDPDDDQEGDHFGASIAIYGSTIVVGAPFANPDLGFGEVTNAGAAYIFSKTGGSWKQSAKLVSESGSAFDHFGRSVQIHEKSLVISAPGQDYYGAERSGSAYLYRRSRNEWHLQTRLLSSDPFEDSDYGASIAIQGDMVTIGEPGGSARVGKAYIYSIEAASKLPETGFAPHTSTALVGAPKQYETLALSLEIPALSVQASIVGIPRQGASWDVQWLGNSLGYLEGSTYPTLLGNTVVAGHVYLSDGAPGPFIDLHTLRWGDIIILHADGAQISYQVREVYQTSPDDLDVLENRSDGYTWLTLVTCRDFDPHSETYQSRTIVEAVRVE